MSVWIAETLLATTLLMALVMLLRRPTARFLGAGAAYMLWALPLARLALPPLPRGVTPATPLQTAVDQSGLTTILTLPAATPSAATAASPLPWVELAIGLWMLGVALFLAFHLVTYVRFRRLILRDAISIGREGRIRILASPKAPGPLAFGVLRPYVALPLDFDARFDPQERAMALAHECAHHQRGDLLTNMIALGILALHWCNPIAWIAWTRYRADQELACDARVLARHGADNVHAYGRAILKAAGGRQFTAACHLNRLDTLKGRLKMLSNHAESLHRISWGMAAVALVTLAGLALTASGSRAAREMAAITGTVEQVDMARLASLMAQTPQVPQAPEVRAIPAAPQAPVAPIAPQAPAAIKWDAARHHADITSPAPPAPPAPTADMVPPVPPMPPIPSVRVMREDGRIVVAHADGRTEVHKIPTAAELRRMVPVVDVKNGCEGNEMVAQRTTTRADGRQNIRIRICEAAIERQAQQASVIARSTAHAAQRQAMAEIAVARAEMARNRTLSAEARAEALQDMDEAMAEMRADRHD
jgi:bla regulator protein BlaR1